MGSLNSLDERIVESALQSMQVLLPSNIELLTQNILDTKLCNEVLRIVYRWTGLLVLGLGVLLRLAEGNIQTRASMLQANIISHLNCLLTQ